MFADPVEGRFVVGQGEQVIEEHRAVAGPGQVFGKGLGLIAFDQCGQALQMRDIQRPLPTDRQADAV
ncbi:hypothetical protein D9M69_722390 [compost metagenome]